jgi:two-component system nitrogen regulation response regulator GlnG
MDRNLLLISPDSDTVSSVRGALEPLGYGVIHKQKLTSGLKVMTDSTVALLDLADVSASLRQIKSYHPDATILVCSSDRDCRSRAIEEGAYFCMEKPVDASELRVAVQNAFRFTFLRDELDRLRHHEPPQLVLGKGSGMRKVLSQMERAARKDVPVLISGESGTGRELIARAIHQRSQRRNDLFSTVEEKAPALETALFGEGASGGKLAQAEGGTVFVKNLEGIDSHLRDRLSRFLKDRTLSAEGTAPTLRANVRVICSANGSMRRDPILKSFGAHLSLPPLRKRAEDIIPLAEHFLSEAAESFGLPEKGLAREVRQAISRHDWPGNVGELKHTIFMAALLSGDTEVQTRHLVSAGGSACYSMRDFLEVKLERYLAKLPRSRNSKLHSTVMSEAERSLIELVLRATEGNQVRAASALGMNRTTLRTKVKKYRIPVAKT